VIDLDLLYFDQLQLTDPALTIPHPRMRRRRFVLQPLADIRASLRLPGDSADILALLHSLSTDEQPLTLVTAVW
jgi:2-amino-4-hydroxy-6-hydroxymethyldihydropteridine diphosphokinase